MDSLGSQIQSILSDPQALSQIKELGESLGLSNDNTKTEQIHNSKSADILAGLSDNNSQFQLISKLMPVLSDLNTEDDITRLLVALRPFLSSERQDKLDKASKMLKIFKLLPLVKDLDIFS